MEKFKKIFLVCLIFGLSIALVGCGGPSRDITKYQRLLKEDPHNPELHFELGKTYFTLEEYHDAAKEFEKTLELMSGSEEEKNVYNYLGSTYQKLDNYDEAMKVYRKYLSFHPKDTGEVLNTIGYLYWKKKEYAKAIPEFEMALKIYPEAAQTWVNLGVNYRELEKLGEAEACFQKALELDPENEVAKGSLVEIRAKRLLKNYLKSHKIQPK